LATRVLTGLGAGFLLGLALATGLVPGTATILAVVGPVGTIFINLIRMTVIPLVASMLVASVGSMAASGGLGRVAVRAALIALALVTVGAVGTMLIAAPVLAHIHIDQSAAMALRGPAPASNAGAQPAGTSAIVQWVVDLVPPNVVKAAADGAMLPVIVFSALFGVALARGVPERRDAVLRVTQGVADAMQRLVAAILELAPIGVFALAVPLASTLGLAAAGAVVAYIVLVVSLTVLVCVLLLYPVGILGGSMTPRAFIAFCAPAQAVAFASRSSLAALPAMVESAERANMPPAVSRFVLPLAVSVSRVGAAVAQPVGVLFLAQLYGIALSPGQLAAVVFPVMLTTFAVGGIPGGSIIAMVPVLAALNLPIEGIGILLAVDTIPDMFRTTANVTGSMTLAAVMGRFDREPTYYDDVRIDTTKNVVDNPRHEGAAPKTD
jgi:Na+/H+-dicarboxylate symporter